MKYTWVILGAIALAIGWTFLTYMPLPDSNAREAVGKRVFIEQTENTRFPTIYYVSGSGPRVILIASAGREASDYNELVAILNSKGYRTLVIEHGGIGGLQAPDYPDIVGHLSPIYQALNDDGFDFRTIDSSNLILIGHAYGNRIARVTSYDIASHDKVNGVILLAAGGQVPPDPEADAALKRVFDPLRSYKKRMDDVRTAFFAPGNEIPDHWTRGWHTKTAIAQGQAKSEGDDSWHCAGGVPMLIIQPMQDRIAPPENAYALRDKCPQEVEIVEIENAGHALLPEQPDAVAEAVLDFLAKHHPVSHR